MDEKTEEDLPKITVEVEVEIKDEPKLIQETNNPYVEPEVESPTAPQL